MSVQAPLATSNDTPQTAHALPQPAPAVSIALLVKNGMPELAELLRRLKSQVVDFPFEIVAVDSGSRDGSDQALRDAGVRIHRIDPAQFSFGPTRQLAFSFTRADVIVTMSQDVLPIDEHFLEKLTAPIRRGEADITQCYDLPPENLRFYWQRQYQLCALPLYPNLPLEYHLSCVCMAISRRAWEMTGFGDTPMCEDKYLGQLAFQRKLRVSMITEPLVWHGHDYDLPALARRFFNEGLGVRHTGGRFTAWDMIKGLLRPGMWRWTIASALKREIKTSAELIFIVIHPIMLWLGFRFGKRYWR